MTLTDQLETYAADKSAPGSIADVAIRRAFMAGALAALTTKGRTRDELLAECVAFGRGVGSRAERAAINVTTTPT